MPRPLWQKLAAKHDEFPGGEGLRRKIRSHMCRRKILRTVRLSNPRDGQMRMIGTHVTREAARGAFLFQLSLKFAQASRRIFDSDPQNVGLSVRREYSAARKPHFKRHASVNCG